MKDILWDILNVLFGLVEILLGYGLISALMLVLLSRCWLVAYRSCSVKYRAVRLLPSTKG